MAKHTTAFRMAKSVTGAALILFGIFVLHDNVTAPLAWLHQVVGGASFKALGFLPAAMVAFWHVFHAVGADHQRFVLALFRQILAPFWPLLLVLVGTTLSRDGLLGVSTYFPKNRGLTCRSAPR